MMKAFVTGGTGFLGKNLVLELLKQHWSVWVLHRRGSDTRFFDKLKVELVEGDITERSSLKIPPVDCVFHCAADVSLWTPKNSFQDLVNIQGSKNIAEACLESGVKRLIHTSSVAVWGLHSQIINEESEKRGHLSPINYMKSKLFAEQEILRFLDRGLEIVILNPCHIMGPYDAHNWARLFTMLANRKLPGVPPGLGTFCHVQDVAKAHISAVTLGAIGENYLLGGDQLSYKDLAEKICLLLKTPPPRAIPQFVLECIGRVQSFYSKFSGKEPDVTYEKARLMSHDIIVDSSKSENILHYRSAPVDKIIEDSYQWLLSADVLKVYHEAPVLDT